jgi:hypothetical protein
MGSTNLIIGVWLSIALFGVMVYMFPALMKQLFFVKEQFQARVEESKDAWKYERPTLDERFVDVPKAAANPIPESQHSASTDFNVGGAGGNSLESQPAPVDFVDATMTPMQQQGMQMKKAPAPTGPLEGFQGTGPSSSPVAAPVAAPGAAPSAALAPTCNPQLTYNPTGDPVYTCDGKIITTPIGQVPEFPTWLRSATTKDGIDSDEAAIMNYWLANENKDMPGWVKDLASSSTLSASEKKAFATWAKDNTKPSQAVVKPTSGSSASSTSSTSSTGSTGSTGSSCKPKCKPKPTCPAPAPVAKTCKGPIDMGEYIRKDSIPCWGCSL